MNDFFSNFFNKISRLALPKVVVVGLDIQDRHVVAVATLRKGDKITPLASGVYELPEETIQHGEVRDIRPLQQAIRSVLASLNPTHLKFAAEPVFMISIPSQHLYTQTAFFPAMKQSDLAGAVRLKVETSIPWPIDETYYDWTVTELPDKEQVAVFIAAVDRKTLNEYLKVVATDQWRVGACEFHILSLSAFIDKNALKSFIFALIDEDGIEFGVFAYGTIIAHYLHPIPAAGDEVNILEAKVRQLTTYVESNFGINVDRVFVFDRVSRENMLQNLNNITGIPTQLFSPEARLNGSDPRLLIAQGAAFRSYTSHEATINLVPTELGGRYQENLFLKTINLWMKVLAVFAVSFVCMLGALFAFARYEGIQAQANIAGQSAVLDRLLVQSQPLINEAHSFNVLARLYRTILQNRTTVGKQLNTVVTHATETGLQIQGLSSGENTISGTFVAPTRDAVLEFTRRVQADPTHPFHVDIPLSDLAPEKSLTIHALMTPPQ